MLSIFTFIGGIITRMNAISVVWFVLDKFNDRNTELMVVRAKDIAEYFAPVRVIKALIPRNVSF